MEQEVGCPSTDSQASQVCPPRRQQGKRLQPKQQDPHLRTVVSIKVQTSQDVGLGHISRLTGYREQSAAACPEVETPGYEKQRFQIVFACLQKLLEDGGVTKETNKASLTTFSTTPRGGPGDVNRASPSPLRSRKTHAETW